MFATSGGAPRRPAGRTLPCIRVCTLAASLACLAALAVPVLAQGPTDVPTGHWARAAVQSVVSRGVMLAPAGRFNGSATVTRQEMAITMARLGRSLEAGKWPTANAPVRKPAPASARNPRNDRPITRYELAAAIDRVARYAAQGLPKPGGQVFLKSEALPPPSRVPVPRSDPAYESLVYLTRNRMLWRPSPLLTSGSRPVKASEAVDALSMVIVGVNDKRTGEPQNRPDLGEGPAKPRTGPAPKPTRPL